jgi:hypothetical protein
MDPEAVSSATLDIWVAVDSLNMGCCGQNWPHFVLKVKLSFSCNAYCILVEGTLITSRVYAFFSYKCILCFVFQNAGMRLYGGAQYHRAMAEFRLVVGSIKCPPITREEIVNACGVEDIHDGTNYSRYSLSIRQTCFCYNYIVYLFTFNIVLLGLLV